VLKKKEKIVGVLVCKYIIFGHAQFWENMVVLLDV